MFFNWRKITISTISNVIEEAFVSIVIAVRNEEKSIENLINDLLQQNYPSQLFEIIIVNDHSEDQTLKILKYLSQKHSQIRVLDLPNQKLGKKAALDLGILNATSEYILTLDADCRIGTMWLLSIIQCFHQENADFVIGPVLLHSQKKSFCTQFQSLEFLSLIASGAGAAGAKRPIMCNGANLGFKKMDYIEVKNELNQKTPSGDDVFLLLALKKKNDKKVVFLKNREALVTTTPTPNFILFLEQRKRWASKSRFYRDIDIVAVAAIIGLFNLGIVATLLIALVNIHYLILFAILYGLKFLVDFPLLNSFSKFFGNTRLMQYFWLAELLYPFYMVAMFFYANLGSYKWKNRKYNLTTI